MIRILAIFTLLPIIAFSQINMQQLGYLDIVSSHNSDASDIWGYADGNGNEYAIVGLNNGTSVVDVTDPANPVEVFFESGMNSIWRDIKTWNNHAYVTTEEPQGLLIIDLSTLPGNPNLTTNYYNGPLGNEWASAHNLFIDENGICYIFGADRDNGGAIMLDLTSDPMNPTEVGTVDQWYSHDGVARGDTLYMGHIGDGHMSIWDVSNKTNPILLGQQTTPGNFAHNLWMSDDGDYIYSTDEITNGYLGEFDISDPNNIIEIDRIQSNPGMNVIPHNTHFMDDYIFTSYYRDGVVIHDVSNKGNMVEVANFDTSPAYSGDGYNGCWGVYPWLPSGNIIASDIENGLYILGANLVRGCYLEGNVTDAITTAPINGVTISMLTNSVTGQSTLIGDYAIGYHTQGTYDVVYSHPSYISDTIYGVSLVNGQLTVQDAQLTPLPNFDLTVRVDEMFNIGNPIQNAEVVIENADFYYSGTTNSLGEIIFTPFYEGDYNIYIGKWGYMEDCQQVYSFGLNDTVYTASLEAGYKDLFNLDLGWQASGNAPDGKWERGEPVGTSAGGNASNPDVDVNDCGDKAYVTGNGGLSAGSDDVDFADAILTSPIMDLSSYTAPQVSLNYWWRDFSGQVFANDSLTFIIFDGTNNYTVAEFYQSDDSPSWEQLTFNIGDFTSSFSTIQLIIKTADWDALGGNLVEAAVDNFVVNDAVGVGDKQAVSNLKIYPNPSLNEFTINLGEDATSVVTISVYDVFGKLVLTKQMVSNNTILSIEIPGIYTVIARGVGFNPIPVKVIKL